MITLSSPAVSARISPTGAQVLDASIGGVPLLWRSPLAGPTPPVRGGVPVCFPWFGRREGLPAHGFARTRGWTVESADLSRVEFSLSDDDATRALWPHAFAARLAVAADDALRFALTVTNTGDSPFDFTYALHSYFAVPASSAVDLAGSSVRPIDQVFPDVPDRLVLRDGDRRISVSASGMPDAVVWNPGPNTVADIGEGWRDFLCVERGRVTSPVVLAPGERHEATMTLATDRP